MKRIFILGILSLCLIIGVAFAASNGSDQVQAQNYTKDQKQPLEQLLLTLFNQKIDEAVANYYNDDSLYIQWVKDNVVEVDQSEKGHTLEYTHNGKKQQFGYVVKFTVRPQKDKILGTDTITFGVQPGAGVEPTIEMISYDHNDD
ncbi:DUF3888 domain-containing protein [Pseudalkalibacillus sp. JSM 102089]|uniref:DUF3888 domain-containing protein n=1 Tax=Pseudalkalibacillus sp. JSM 102089 TaxID=3229856 RepID=UPI003526B19C